MATTFISIDSDPRILVLRAGELKIAFIHYKDVLLALTVKISGIYIYIYTRIIKLMELVVNLSGSRISFVYTAFFNISL